MRFKHLALILAGVLVYVTAAVVVQAIVLTHSIGYSAQSASNSKSTTVLEQQVKSLVKGQHQQVVDGQKELPGLLTKIADDVAAQDKTSIDSEFLHALSAAFSTRGKKIVCTQPSTDIVCRPVPKKK